MKYSYAPLFFFILMAYAGYSQKAISELTAHYSLSIKNNLGEDQLRDAEWKLCIKGDQTRTDLTSKLGSESSIWDRKTGVGMILKEYSGQKLLINLTQEDWLRLNKDFRNMVFNIQPGITTINDYACKKATAANGEKMVELYFSDDYPLLNNDYNMSFLGIRGLPVKIIINDKKAGNEWVATYLLNNLNTDIVPITLFNPSHNGFRVLNFSEMMKNKK